MNADTADIQKAMVSSFFQTVIAFVLGALVVIGLTAAAERARQQDETRMWREYASHLASLEPIHHGDRMEVGFVSIIADRETGARIQPRTLNDLRTFDATHLRSAADSNRELDCLAEAIYYEARSEGRVGQLAVAEVVLNRVRHGQYPDTICGVVYQGSERTTGCQFTFTCDGSLMREPRGRSWERSRAVAEHALLGFARPVTRRATHYHTVAVDPYWNDNLMRTRRIGTHIFYRFATRRERVEVLEREL